MAKPATKDDLFDGTDDDRTSKAYSAKDIEVLVNPGTHDEL